MKKHTQKYIGVYIKTLKDKLKLLNNKQRLIYDIVKNAGSLELIDYRCLSHKTNLHIPVVKKYVDIMVKQKILNIDRNGIIDLYSIKGSK